MQNSKSYTMMVLQLQFDQVLVEIISSEFKVPLTVSATVLYISCNYDIDKVELQFKL